MKDRKILNPLKEKGRFGMSLLPWGKYRLILVLHTVIKGKMKGPL